MKIARHSWVASKDELVTYRAKLSASAATAALGELPTADQLCDSDATFDWAVVGNKICADREGTSALIRMLHFRRNCDLPTPALRNIWRFLLEAYARSNDLRCFNELLWFAHDSDYLDNRQTAALSLGLFFTNLDSRGRHVFPCATVDEIATAVNASVGASKIFDTRRGHGTRVGLLGSPSFFGRLRSELLALGFEPRCYLVRHHAEPMPRLLLQSPHMLRLFLTLKGVNFPFEDLGSDPTSPSIGAVLRRDAIDLCFHKLGFIIKKGTIDGPRLGIINDHWGALPFVRGRSTIEWSLIHGIPLVATTHLVDEGIDTGRLVAMFDYSHAIGRAQRVSQIRRIIKRDEVRRALISICRLSTPGAELFGNPPTMGATFYSMHPELVRYLESVMLRHE